MAEVDVDLLTVTTPEPEVVIAPEIVLESAIEIIDPYPKPTEEIIEIVPQEIAVVELVIPHIEEESKKMEVEITEEGEDVVVKHKHKHQHKHEVHYEKENIMEPVNVFANPMGNDGTGAGLGAGLGGGLLGGILAGALFGNRGLGVGTVGGVVDGGVVTPALLSASLAQVTDTAMNTTVLQTLGDIKASVPLAEGQMQLALAGAQADINSNINMGVLSTLQGQFAINKNISEAIAASLASQGAIKETVLTSAAANLAATKDAQFILAQTITSDGEKTRALITTNQIADLNRLAAERQDEIIELRNNQRRDADRHGIEITMNNNQNQQQLQFQQQAQAINTLGSMLHQCDQNIRATSQAINIGAGTQTANPVNTNTNNKVNS